MKALAGPAMILVMVGGFMIYRATHSSDTPSLKFTELELAADDADHTGTCYALSTVLVANGIFGNALRTWNAPEKGNKDKWTLVIENVIEGPNGPVHVFQNFTFEKSGEQLRLVKVEASEGYPTEIGVNIDRLLEAPHARHSTPVDRCAKDGGIGYQFPPEKK
jgi:hypothetical protein